MDRRTCGLQSMRSQRLYTTGHTHRQRQSQVMELKLIKNLPGNKSSEPNGFTGEFCQTFRDELTPILLKQFQKLAEG